MNNIEIIHLREIIICLLLTFTLIFFFKKPLIWIFKVIIRGTLFSVLMFLINFITMSFNFFAGINPVTTFICGIFGIYGVILNYILAFIFI
ncbi:MAG: transcriptional regulator [Ruminococcaceae bacterium]|nr:transcriptional regulator [Oscillospiraceae bacterium]